jgi:hypothetical protein
MTTITIDLPDDVAMQARAAGLLGTEQVLSIFKDSLRAAARNLLFNQHDAAVQSTDDLSPSEQDALVQEAKLAARKARHSGA